jgi:hypothetical protein
MRWGVGCGCGVWMCAAGSSHVSRRCCYYSADNNRRDWRASCFIRQGAGSSQAPPAHHNSAKIQALLAKLKEVEEEHAQVRRRAGGEGLGACCLAVQPASARVSVPLTRAR